MGVADKIYVSAAHTDEDIKITLQAFRAGAKAVAALG